MRFFRKCIKAISKDFFCMKVSIFFRWLKPNGNGSFDSCLPKFASWLKPNGKGFFASCLLLIAYCSFPIISKAQNKEFAKQVIEKLCSDEYSGRGYINDGDKKAAKFIAETFRKNRLSSPTIDYYQNFGFPVITFPGETELNIDGVGLEGGREFIVNAGCPPISGKFKIMYIDSATIDNNFLYEKFIKQSFRKYFLVVSDLQNKKFIHPERVEKIIKNEIKARGLIYNNLDKFTWTVATEKDEYPIIYIQKNAIKHSMIEMEININSFPVSHQTQNVIGIVKGKVYPDSFIVITAHYDHLGKFGNAIFPGANDNASGIAMMLDMVNFIAKNPLDYSVAFIAFAGEEAGLLGSFYYTQNPSIPLHKMAMLLNLDLMATGDKGMTAVNATEFPDEFKLLQYINEQGNYLPSITHAEKHKIATTIFLQKQELNLSFFT
jgi:aminopeptidase YwaD